MLTWWGEPIDLFDHPYNTTALNERAVEIPVARRWMQDQTGVGLEVGNVLSHYQPVDHRVVDLNEGPEHLDVFNVAGTFDWVLSISTLEHVRWDEPPVDPDGAARAITHLRGLLNPGGQMLATVPMGYHPPLDDHLMGGAGTDRCCTIVRPWHQTKRKTRKPYGPWAQSLWIGEWSA